MSPLTPQQAARYLGLRCHSLDTMRCIGRGPVFFRAENGRPRYTQAELNKYLRQRGLTPAMSIKEARKVPVQTGDQQQPA